MRSSNTYVGGFTGEQCLGVSVTFFLSFTLLLLLVHSYIGSDDRENPVSKVPTVHMTSNLLHVNKKTTVLCKWMMY